MQTNVVVKGGRVVEGDTLELLQRCSQGVKFGESTTTLRFDLALDGSQPATLKLDTLRNDLLVKAAR